MEPRTSTRKPGRPRAGQSPLTRERILETALAVVDEHGMKALSMRRVASELGVDPMSLYHHVDGKAGLLTGLVEIVFSEMETPGEEGPWEERVRSWATAYRKLALAHPNLVLQIVSDSAAVSGAMLLVSEPLYQALSDAELSPRAIVHAAGTVVDLVNGFVLAEAPRPTAAADKPTILDRLRAQPADRLPVLRGVHQALQDAGERAGFDDSFTASIDILVAGIAAHSVP